MQPLDLPAPPVFVPAIPDTAPFTPEQRAWLNGYLAGLFCRAPAPAVAAPAAKALAPLTILWGSQTGTCEGLAKKIAKGADKRGFAATIRDMAQVAPADLAQIENLLILTSTYGDGEPPDNAKGLHAALRAPDAEPLPATLRYSVCALGDSNYPKFCQCGIDIDEALARLGATRVADRVDCDVDYDAPHANWLAAALKALAPADSSPTPSAQSESDEHSETGYGKDNPFAAPVLAVRKLNGAGSAKEVNHVEISLEGSGLVYEAGDALGVIPQNCPDLVDATIGALGCDGEEAVVTPVGELPLRIALGQNFDLGKPSPKLLAALKLEASPEINDVLDAIEAAPKPLPGLADVVSHFKKLQPRLYSISSSPKAHPGEVHLTVGAVRYESGGRARKGACSTFLAERALAARTVGVFVHSNKAFRPPADPAAPAIMVGPGTGIAPFRAFLEERAATGAKGKNWLFFGDQHIASDYLYRDEIEAWQRSGILTRVDTAFSRDQERKVYVQDRMRESGAELFAWLQEGAGFYVCGDASRMAKDVDAALRALVAMHGSMSPEAADAYVEQLKKDKRYLRDVY